MRSRVGAADFLAVFLCSAVFSAGGWLFWTGFNKAIAPSGAQRIGTLTFKVKNAQRKYTDRAVWETLPVNAPLYSYDSIRTAEGSSAVLKLDNGAEVYLDENSLILLDYDSQKRNIEFLYGSMSAGESGSPGGAAAGDGSRGAALTISSKGSKVSLGKGQASLRATKEGDLGVTVTSGSVGLTVEGKAQEIKENEKAEVAAGAKAAKVEALPVSISSPASDQRSITFSGAADIRFAWKSDRPADRYRLEVSPNAAFTSVAASAEAEGTEAGLALAPGTWYARVSADAEGAEPSLSAAVRFHVIKESPPEGLSPPDGALFSYRSAAPAPRFLWRGSDLASGYLLELSSDPDFRNVVAREEAEAMQASVAGLPEGEYWWRVKPAFAFGYSGYGPASAAMRFAIRRTAELKAAEAVLPLDGQVVFEKAFKEAGIRFSWKQSPEAQSSTLAVYRKQDAADPVLRIESKTAFLDLNSGLGPGDYVWQVHSLAADGIAAPPSAPRSFSITDKVPRLALSEPADGAERDAIQGSRLRFAWDSEVPLAYALEIAKDESFADPARTETAASSIELPGLDPGSYRWRVSAFDPKGILISRSETRTLAVLAPLEAPRLLRPGQGEILELINEPGLDFGWQGPADAQSYALRILDQAGKAVFSRTDIAATSFRLEDLSAFKAGRYTAELRALRPGKAGQRSSAPASASFSISRITRLSPPELAAPAEGAAIAEADMRRAGIEFAWKNDPALPKARFTLSSDPGFRQIISEESLEASRTRIARLDPGTYYWSVSGIDDAGRSYPSAQRSFEVKKAPPLQPPAVTAPAQGARVDMANRNSLSFSWKPAREATHYALKLANRKTGAAIATVDALKASKWEFSDLDKLDIGPFSLTIQSLAMGLDGQIVRRSAPATIDFEIILSEAPGAPKILSPDTMYVP